MRRLFRWFVGLPIAIIAVAFAIANRQWITISLDPLSSPPRAAIDMPLWALLFVGIFLGILAGWGACWVAQGKWRRSAKEARRELARQASPAAASSGREVATMAEFQP